MFSEASKPTVNQIILKVQTYPFGNLVNLHNLKKLSNTTIHRNCLSLKEIDYTLKISLYGFITIFLKRNIFSYSSDLHVFVIKIIKCLKPFFLANIDEYAIEHINIQLSYNFNLKSSSFLHSIDIANYKFSVVEPELNTFIRFNKTEEITNLGSQKVKLDCDYFSVIIFPSGKCAFVTKDFDHIIEIRKFIEKCLTIVQKVRVKE
jgi:hypothetical protein